MATLDEWLEANRDGVPNTLWQRLETCASPYVRQKLDAVAGLQRMAHAQMTMLGDLACVEREDAAQLLATDACITYLLESAALHHVQDLGSFAGDVLRFIAAVGERDAELSA